MEETTLTNENNIQVPSVTATCTRCGHETESYGTSDASVRRCLALMRGECPEGEGLGSEYYYFAEGYE